MDSQAEKLDEITDRLERVLDKTPDFRKFWIALGISLVSILATVVISFTNVKKDTQRALELALDENRHITSKTLDDKIVSYQTFLTAKNNLKDANSDVCEELTKIRERIRKLEQKN